MSLKKFGFISRLSDSELTIALLASWFLDRLLLWKNYNIILFSQSAWYYWPRGTTGHIVYHRPHGVPPVTLCTTCHMKYHRPHNVPYVRCAKRAEGRYIAIMTIQRHDTTVRIMLSYVDAIRWGPNQEGPPSIDKSTTTTTTTAIYVTLQQHNLSNSKGDNSAPSGMLGKYLNGLNHFSIY